MESEIISFLLLSGKLFCLKYSLFVAEISLLPSGELSALGRVVFPAADLASFSASVHLSSGGVFANEQAFC